MNVKYSHIKKAIQSLRKYGYIRMGTWKAYSKYWTQGYTTYAVTIDIFDLALMNEDLIIGYLEHMEAKALHMLEESEK